MMQLRTILYADHVEQDGVWLVGVVAGVEEWRVREHGGCVVEEVRTWKPFRRESGRKRLHKWR